MPLEADESEENPPRTAEEHKPASTKNNEPDAAALIVLPNDGRSSAQPNERATDQADDYAQQDLVAQIRMADATERIVDQTYFQIGIASLGLLLGVGTVVFAYWAAREAKRAADAAQATINFMRKAERPFLVVTQVVPQEFGKAIKRYRPGSGRKTVSVKVTVKNMGTRPGIPRSLHPGRCFQPAPIPQPAIASHGKRAGNKAIAPKGTSNDFLDSFVLKENDIRAMGEGTGRFCVYGYIRYADMHGNLWRSGYSFEYIGPSDMITDGHFVQSSPTDYWYDEEEQPEGPAKRRRWPWPKPHPEGAPSAR